jgi:hypothetical protein
MFGRFGLLEHSGQIQRTSPINNMSETFPLLNKGLTGEVCLAKYRVNFPGSSFDMRISIHPLRRDEVCPFPGWNIQKR